MTELVAPLAQIAVLLLAAAAAGFGPAGLLGPSSRCERAGWGFAIGLSLLALGVPLSFALNISPRWTILILLAASCVFSLCLSLLHRSPSFGPQGREKLALRSLGGGGFSVLLFALVVLGAAIYALRALTEPMCSNDFQAIWGFKGKTIFGAGAIPSRLFHDPAVGFSHPEYPLGLPLLYAALAFVLGRFDDHAMALLFPLLQVATLFVLYGWLRRKAGASRNLALSACALLALFEPLRRDVAPGPVEVTDLGYSAFLTGMAEVPFSFVALLFATALADALDGGDPGAGRRLAFACFLAVSVKNEGLLLAAAGLLLALLSFWKTRSVRRPVLAALVLPAALLAALGRLWKGPLPWRDFDLRYLDPSRFSQLLPRLRETLRAAGSIYLLPAWPGLLCLAVLLLAGRRTPRGGRLLALVLLCTATYLLSASIAALGPEWLVRVSVGRIACALAPVLTAAIACRLAATDEGEGRPLPVDPAQAK